ncbi:MAG TPA: aldolase/citrate lyase family protein [Ruminiclostridium sp.]
MIRENKIKIALKEGKSLIGTFVKATDPAVIEVLGLAGFDFVIIDNEHTSMNKESMVGLIRAADISGMDTVVRVGQNNAMEILQALDAGAMGVQVPQIDSKAEAQSVVDRVKYAPIGKRGYASSQRSAGYGFMNAKEYGELSNKNTLVVCYCETLAAINNLDDILTVDEIDVIFIGPYDLSQALGVLGEPEHSRVKEAVDGIIAKVTAANKAVGIIASDAEQTQKWIDKGVQFISLNSDLGMIASLGKQYIKSLKK